MANPFNNNRVNPMDAYDMGSIRNMYQTIMNSRNPMQMFENLARHNPNMQPILNALRNGASPQSVFESMCKQRGINPSDFLRSIQGK